MKQELEKEKIGLSKGLCSGRFECVNINTFNCNPLPKNNNNFIECKYFVEKKMYK